MSKRQRSVYGCDEVAVFVIFDLPNCFSLDLTTAVTFFFIHSDLQHNQTFSSFLSFFFLIFYFQNIFISISFSFFCYHGYCCILMVFLILLQL